MGLKEIYCEQDKICATASTSQKEKEAGRVLGMTRESMRFS